MYLFFFFFQAEDGIRDIGVTGVQTCALPILNATTRLDETFYQVCNVPIGRQSTLDSCLLILHDWAGALTLNETDINHERNVIRSEEHTSELQSRQYLVCRLLLEKKK